MKQVNHAESKQIIKDSPIVVIDVYANWCGPCKQLEPILEKLSDHYEHCHYPSVVFLKVNAEEEYNFLMEHIVSSIPTVLFFKNGVLVTKLVGFKPIGEFTTILDGLLENP